MSFAILGANAALVPNRVRPAKSVNNTRVSTVTVAVRPEFPALDATRSQSQYNHVSHARYLDRLVSVPLAALETRVSTEDPVRFSRSAQRKTDVAVRFPSFPFLGDWWFTTRNRPKKPSLRKSDPRGRGERTPGAKWRRRMTLTRSPGPARLCKSLMTKRTGHGQGLRSPYAPQEHAHGDRLQEAHPRL